jgi:hypothetical protein
MTKQFAVSLYYLKSSSALDKQKEKSAESLLVIGGNKLPNALKLTDKNVKAGELAITFW